MRNISRTACRVIPENLSRGIEDNRPKGSRSLRPRSLVRLSDALASIKRIAPGDQMTVGWVPGVGSVVSMQ